jgi:hypothetical protein
MIRRESKAHLDRGGCVGQSILVQVHEHMESTLRQYNLAAQAARWMLWAGGQRAPSALRQGCQVVGQPLGEEGERFGELGGFRHDASGQVTLSVGSASGEPSS